MFLFLFLLSLVAPSKSINISNLECNSKLLFVIDSSSSINNSELFGKPHTFKRFKNKVIDIIEQTDVKEENIGLVTFDTTPSIIFNFNTNNTKSSMIGRVNTLNYHRTTKHTNLDLALQLIESNFIEENYKILNVIFFTDTHIGDEFIQPDNTHYNYIENRFRNSYWNNDYIEKYIYYEGNKINRTVLDLFIKPNQLNLTEPFKSTCVKQKCLDTFCIKKTENYHKICINETTELKIYNSHCHYFCSIKNLLIGNWSLIPVDTCHTNTTNNNIYNFSNKSRKTRPTDVINTTINTPTPVTTNTITNTTTVTTTNTITNTTTVTTINTPTPVTTNTITNTTTVTTTNTITNPGLKSKSTKSSMNLLIIELICVLVILLLIVISCIVYKRRNYLSIIDNDEGVENNEIIDKDEIIDNDENMEDSYTFNNRAFDNSFYDNNTNTNNNRLLNNSIYHTTV
jgi:hypothetical protein